MSNNNLFNIKNTCNFLNISYKSLKKLVDEGYLKNISNDKNYILFDKKEVEDLKNEIDNIKKFWNYKTKINRKSNIENINKNKKNYFADSFKVFLDKKTSSLKHLDSLIVRNSIFLIYIRNHLEEKKNKNIKDKSLNKLYLKCLNKIINLLKNLYDTKFYYYKGNSYIIYCESCKEKNILNTCEKCIIDYDYCSKNNSIIFYR
ncbi:MAG: hypothetical protein KatS3mg068_0577 [Candidatus Sericytochromatia bacterium]|nr:MAG: hypothetical protein KatS3mg068_0577 [Candidatus Sericytochromatia bacterium]